MLGKHSIFVSIKKTIFSLAWWLLPVVPTLEGQKHEDEKFEVIPGYTVTSTLTWVMSLARDTKCLVLLGFCRTFDGGIPHKMGGIPPFCFMDCSTERPKTTFSCGMCSVEPTFQMEK